MRPPDRRHIYSAHSFDPLRGTTVRASPRTRATGLALLALCAGTIPLLLLFSRDLLPARADTVLATDTFARTVSSGWGSADVGGDWTILDSASTWSVAPGTGSIDTPANA